MILPGKQLQWNGRGGCDLLSLSFLPNHLAELSAYVMIGPVGPMSFACRSAAHPAGVWHVYQIAHR